MIKEEGIVTSATQSIAWIKTTRKTACETCQAKDNCEILNSKKAMHFKVQNTLNVEQGNYVVVGVQTKPLLLLTFMLYFFPVFLLLIGALAGNSLALVLKINQNFSSLSLGFLLFFLAIFIVKQINNKISGNAKYKPFLIKLLKR